MGVLAHVPFGCHHAAGLRSYCTTEFTPFVQQFYPTNRYPGNVMGRYYMILQCTKRHHIVYGCPKQDIIVKYTRNPTQPPGRK